MARNPLSDVPLDIPSEARGKLAQTVTFPVDVPLQAEVVLRLRFTAAASCGFVRVLRVLEDEGFSLADQSAGINLQ